MSRARMGAALLSLAGFFVAAYLYLYKIGKIGTIACGTGGCETVQLSAQSRFLGIEVALIGVIGYLVLLGLALLTLQPKFAGAGWPSRLLAWLSGGAVGFTVYLTYVELFVIQAICWYCVASAVIVTVICLLAITDLRKSRRLAA
ncbi:MAG: vitamin K epoxide reductase family protein [Gemmatimonadales bacterium]